MMIDASLVITDKGPPVGTYREMSIPAWFDKAGQRFTYDRIALEDSDGTTPLAQLRPDEFVVAPGLIYRRASAQP